MSQCDGNYNYKLIWSKRRETEMERESEKMQSKSVVCVCVCVEINEQNSLRTLNVDRQACNNKYEKKTIGVIHFHSL